MHPWLFCKWCFCSNYSSVFVASPLSFKISSLLSMHSLMSSWFEEITGGAVTHWRDSYNLIPTLQAELEQEVWHKCWVGWSRQHVHCELRKGVPPWRRRSCAKTTRAPFHWSQMTGKRARSLNVRHFFLTCTHTHFDFTQWPELCKLEPCSRPHLFAHSNIALKTFAQPQQLCRALHTATNFMLH